MIYDLMIYDFPNSCRVQIINRKSSIINDFEFDLFHLPKSVIAHWKTELCDKVLNRFNPYGLSTSEVPF